MVATLACVLGLATAGAPLSKSKISVQILDDNYSAGAQQIVAAGPRVLKIFDLGSGMRKALRDYKTRYPKGVVVVRIWTTLKWSRDVDPAQAGREYWEKVLKGPYEGITPQERRWIDYWEGPNEGDCTPTWATVEDARWFGKFWVSLAAEMRRNGVRPNIGSIPVGNPAGDGTDYEDKVVAFLPAFEAAKRARGSWGYHAYTIGYTQDPEEESWYSLRYRRTRDFVRKHRRDLADLPLILTEGGVDKSGNRLEDGWRPRGTPERFQQWLRWFDGELRKDPYVIGVTLFQLGGTYWPAFDVDPIAPWLAEYLRSG